MRLHLKYLLLLRVFAIGGQIAALFITQYLFSIVFPVPLIVMTITVLSLYTIVSWLRMNNQTAISEQSILAQLLIDVVALTILIYFTGGTVNPFISLFLLPITFAAASLRPTYTWLIVVAAISCYTLLMFFHAPIVSEQHYDESFMLHLWGMWCGFMLSAGLIAYFVSRIGRALRERDHALALARQEAIYDDQILALGTLAAGTAHELGTPLSTMAVLTKELENEYRNKKDLVDNLRLLQEQIDRCKHILSRMASDAGQLQADSGHRMRLNDYIKAIINDWQSLCPYMDARIKWSGRQPSPEVIVDQTLTHAIVNVLNNAADASSTVIEVDSNWDDEQLKIEIKDNGEGLSADALRKIGQTIYSSKTPDKGLGFGLLLAKTTLNRFGGTIELTNRSGGGVCAEITLPLSPILA